MTILRRFLQHIALGAFRTHSDPDWGLAATKFKPGEPIFILRAQDVLAAGIVETWIVRGKHHGVSPDKLASAQKIADAMREWPTKKVPD